MATPAEDKRLADAAGEVAKVLAARRQNTHHSTPLPTELLNARVIALFLDSFYIATNPEDRHGLYVCCNHCTTVSDEWMGTSADGIDVANVLFDHFVETHLHDA